jgi:GR25 family glycosyltransferase involved in LPS biosynthesis
MINEYFDKVYVLNLLKRDSRMELMKKRLDFTEIDHQVFNAVDGSVMRKIWEAFSEKNPIFGNSNYLGCAISHLSIYQHAIEMGHEKILIIEDDDRIHRNANSQMELFSSQIPEWDELLYLGYIPLSDDCSRWDYNVCGNNFISTNVFVAKNLWGLYGYGISKNLMKEILEIYDKDFPMELDRFFVTTIQPRGKSYGVTPQIFAADDGYSDNSRLQETGMLQRSIDARFANLIDYV